MEVVSYILAVLGGVGDTLQEVRVDRNGKYYSVWETGGR
jgi:hypothetical protein